MTTDAPYPDGPGPGSGPASGSGDVDPWAPGADGQPAEPRSAPRRRGLLRAAIALFAIGVVFSVLAALTPFVLGRDAPTVLYLGAMFFTPIGFLLGLAFALLGSRPPRV